jgi:transposase
MVYKEHGMWEVLDILRRIHRGESRRAIVRATGRSRGTIRRYFKAARALGWAPEVAAPDEELASRVVARLQPGPREPHPESVAVHLHPHTAQIRDWLTPQEGNKRGLRLTKIHDLLTRQGVVVPYSSLHRFAVAHCGFGRKRVTVRVADVAPGELAEIDFGRLGLVYDPERERRRFLWVLIVTLVHSRHQYVHTTYSQKLPDVIDGLEDAWEFFEGVTARVVLDNLRAAINRPDRYDPAFQRTFEEYARHRGFIIDPANSGHAQGKPHVERAVPYLRENFFRGEDWIDRDHVQREAVRWCVAVAGTRIHGTTRKAPLRVFEEEEKKALRPLEGESFDTPSWADCLAHPDHHIQFQKALYSVPTRYLREKVTVRGDRKLVRIYHKGQLIKTHPTQAPGGRATDYEDYPDELTPYALRDPQRIIRQGQSLGSAIGRFLEELLAGTFPWARLRQAQKLLRLAQRYRPERVDAACRRALAFDLINVRRVERILTQGLDPSDVPPESRGQLVLFPARFLRPAGSFTHNDQSKEESLDGDQTVSENRPQTAPPLGPSPDAPRSGGVREEGPPGPGGLPGADPPGRD